MIGRFLGNYRQAAIFIKQTRLLSSVDIGRLRLNSLRNIGLSTTDLMPLLNLRRYSITRGTLSGILSETLSGTLSGNLSGQQISQTSVLGNFFQTFSQQSRSVFLTTNLRRKIDFTKGSQILELISKNQNINRSGRSCLNYTHKQRKMKLYLFTCNRLS